jgi:hypothetical protein
MRACSKSGCFVSEQRALQTTKAHVELMRLVAEEADGSCNFRTSPVFQLRVAQRNHIITK